MRVKITHSIDLEEVPEKAYDLLLPIEQKLAQALRWLASLNRDLSDNDIEPELAALSIDRIRRSLGTSDNILEEVQSIMAGVADYKANEVLPPSMPSQAGDTAKTPEQLEEERLLAEDMLRAIKEKQNESDLPF